MPKEKPRYVRWEEAAARCRSEFDKIMAAADELVGALSDLEDIRGEYEDWFTNLPDNLQDSPTGAKLAEVSQIDIESVRDDPLGNWNDVELVVEQAEGVDLPLGPGRD
jgi:hypothetical protein